MKRIFFLLILFATVSNSMPLDTNVFQYYPLNVGNRWTWYIYQNVSPGSGYKTAIITDAVSIRNHVYYKFKYDTYIFYGNQHNISYSYKRIDSLNGNLYTLYISDSSECLSDSLNSGIGDSTYYVCGGLNGSWYRYYSDTMNFFNQAFSTKSFAWSNYFEAGNAHAFAKGLGYVKYEYGAHTIVYNENLRGCLIRGTLFGDTTLYLGINQINSEVPAQFSLYQNYPNPFNPATNIKFDVPESGFIRLVIFDVLGKEVKTLVNEQLSPGTYNADFDAGSLPSGVYYYRLESGSYIETKKMVLIK